LKSRIAPAGDRCWKGEFDLAYSPLMELDYGEGKIIWSQLDLEDHAHT
jgi:hypothetical protein